jgi:hypothetical protein
MISYRITLTTLALCLCFAPLPCLRADPIPWTYSWSRSPTEIQADAPGSGSIKLTVGSPKMIVGDSANVPINLETFSTATEDHKDTFTARPYSLTMTITDMDTGETGSRTFTGQIDGWLWAKGSLLNNTFISPTEQTIDLGHHRYTITIGPYVRPGAPGSDTLGSIGSVVTVSVEGIVQQLPEPGTMILASVGMILLGTAQMRRRTARERRVGE